MRPPKNAFLKGFIFAPLPLAACIILFVVLVDPFWRFGSPLVTGFNRYKIYFTHQVRLSKAHLACAQKPRAAVFGSSRIEQGFMMDHPEWETLGPALNMGMGGMMIDELFQTVRHTYYASDKRLNTVVVGLDFYAFNALRQRIIYDKIVTNFDPHRLLKDDSRSCLNTFIYDADFFLGAKALKASIETVADQYSMNHGEPQYYQHNGADAPNLNMLEIVSRKTPFKSMVTGEISGYVFNTWRPEGSRRYCLATPEFDSLHSFRELVDFALEHHIDLRMFFSPLHAWFDVGLEQAGLYPQYLQWKEKIADIVAEEKAKYKDAKVGLWDPSGFNPITTSPVTDAQNAWYYEGNHYHPRLGKLIMDCLFNTSVIGTQYKQGFCREVNAGNIAAVNREDTMALFRYEKSHQQELQPLKKNIDDIFAKTPGSNCGPTYQYVSAAARKLAGHGTPQEYAAVLAHAETLYHKEAADYRRKGMTFREPDPASTLMLQRAEALEAEGKPAEAIKYYRAYAGLYPQAESYFEKIGYLAAQHGDDANAAWAFAELIKLHPDNVGYYYQHAQALMHSHDWKGVLADCVKALPLQPDSVGLHMFCGEASLQLGDIDAGQREIAFIRSKGVDDAHLQRLLHQHGQ